jgi:hypothetical protein
LLLLQLTEPDYNAPIPSSSNHAQGNYLARAINLSSILFLVDQFHILQVDGS